jgi:hypothetical protein
MAKHYRDRRIGAMRAANQRRDTAEDIRQRWVAVQAGNMANAERLKEFPHLSGANFEAAVRFQEDRIAHHTAMFNDPARPNYGRRRPDVERLVNSYCASRTDDPNSLARVAAVIERIVETGEGVWHAASYVAGTKCWCSPCCIARGEEPVRI